MKGFLPRTLHPIWQVLLLFLLMLTGACIAAFIAAQFATLAYGLSAMQWSQMMSAPSQQPHAWLLMMLFQGLTLAGIGAGAAVLPWLIGYRWAEYFAPRRLGAGWWPLGAAALIIVILPLMSGLIAWNAGAHFPGFLHDFEAWARAKEDQAAVLTKFLTNFNSIGRLLVGFVVIALVPAVAEELVFRGVIQRNLVRWFNSRHVGVWLAAAVFSAIHMQFFGFVPRFVLGLALGYLYEWSGNILVPMAAHFTQNAFQLVLLYIGQSGYLGWDFDAESNEALPWPLVALSAVLTGGLLWWLRQRMEPAAPHQMLTLSSSGIATRTEPDDDPNVVSTSR